MKFNRLVALLAAIALAAVIAVPTGLVAQKSSYAPDKELCARMIAAGKEYYVRGKYLDAKNFFRKAVEADPRSQKAWRYYDQSVIFALAEKVEKKNDLLIPDTSIRSDVTLAGPKRGPVTAPPVETLPKPNMGGYLASEPAEQAEEEGC